MARSIAKRHSLRQAARLSESQSNGLASPAPSKSLGDDTVSSRQPVFSSGLTSPNLSNSTRSGTADFDTPNTSSFVTPAVSVSGRASRSSTRLSTSKAMSFNSSDKDSPLSGTKRKRTIASKLKHSTIALDTSRDELLAQKLQDDEYNGEIEEITPPSKRGRTGKKRSIGDEELAQQLQEDEYTYELTLRPSPNKRSRQSKKQSTTKSQRNVLPNVPDVDLDVSDSNWSISGDSTESEFEGSELADSADENEPIPAQVTAVTSRTNRRGRVRGRRANRPVVVTDDTDAQAGADDTDVADAARQRFNRFRTWHDQRKRARRRKLEKAHPEIVTMWDDLKKVPIIKLVAVPQPATITRTLKSFQLEGVDWMIKQEKTHYKGGLLGDEMGMGKTIQAVSLIMSDFPAKAPSLVLVPPVALMQWQNEINSYTDNTLKVLVVHGSNQKSKNLTVKILKTYNVILMSYNSLESMYRKQEKGWSRGEDVIIKEDSPIHAIHWHRIILDEAHSIKSRTTGSAKACFALEGTYKWCLSGTPVQNRIGEFFSLLRFLGVRPFADYFCERCECAQIHWTIDEEYKCKVCHHSASEHRSVFNEEILNPIIGESGLENRDSALEKLHLITDRMMLRRMKRDHTSSMELPPKLVQIRNEFFSNVERDFATSIMSNNTRQFDTYVSRGVVLNNYANIFGLLMMMRQVANHPDLILKKNAEGGQNVLVCNICDEAAEDAVRSKCHHEFCRSCVKTYINSGEQKGNTVDCTRCHIPLEIDLEQPEIEQDEDQVKKSSIINRIRMSEWTSSTKIELLVYELYKLRSSKRTLKSIVFSQFTSMLQLVEWRLRRAGFTTVMLDGSMTPAQRQRSIDYFMNNPHVEVFLVSLKAGGVALNLTEASRVFIVDPWWNPAAEWQSADRCHRIGQSRPCVITRLVIEDSVESRMVQLQEKKSNLIASTVNKDKVAMDKLTSEDLQFLFRGT